MTFTTLNNNLVSVVIPAYNAGEYLLPAVNSVLNQTYTNIEVLVIDDGSSDDSISTLQGIEDARLTVLSQTNMGKPATLNKALQNLVRGEYFVVQDADDLSYPSRIEEMVAVMNSHQDVAMLFSGYDLIVNGKHMAPSFGALNRQECQAKIDAFKMPGHDPTAMMRTHIAQQFLYNPELRIGEGLDIILRIGEQYPILKLGKCLYSYRVSFNSLTRANVEKRKALIAKVLGMAHQRRGMPMPESTLPSNSVTSINAHDLDNNIAAQFMESAIDLRRAGMIWQAVLTGLQCAQLNPFSAHYYKALIYAILPSIVTRQIRKKSKK